jgi:DNA-binding MarR family transcriptional regulator
MAELADQLASSPVAGSRAIERLGCEALVGRSVIEHDARGIDAELTIAGSRVFDAASGTDVDVDGLRLLFFDKPNRTDVAYLNEIGSRFGQHSGRDRGRGFAHSRNHQPASEQLATAT